MIRKNFCIPIENLRAAKAMTDSNNLAFVITVAPNNKSLFPVIQINFYSLQETYETKECFKDIELIKNNNNLV